MHALTDHSAKAVTLENEHREEAADQEEEGHPEHVDRRIGKEEQAVLTSVLDGPRGWNKTQQGMQDDAEDHCDAPQGIKVSSPGGGGIQGRLI